MATPSIEHLLSQLCDPDPDARQQAIEALAWMGEASIAPLIEKLNDRSADCRWGLPAITALAMIGEPAVQPLLDLLETGDLNLQISAADGLTRIGTPFAIEPIIRILKRDIREIKVMNWRHFALCLARLGQPAIDVVIDGFYAATEQEDLRNYLYMLSYFETAAVEALSAHLEIANADQKRKTRWGLAEIGFDSAFGLFTSWLKDEDATARMFGIWGLRFRHDANLLEYLRPLVNDPDVLVRRMLAAVLNMLDDQDTIPLLEVLRNDPDEQVRQYAE